ncbi:UNVERIFIED_CONTAM: hypothetical protein ABID98_005838 [Brevibacillus sp. OAP136]
MHADETDNNVDNDLTITFTDDSVWCSKVTAVKLGSSILSPDDYSLTNGKVTIRKDVIQTVGDHYITVVATGYQDAMVTQSVKAGAFSSSTSFAELLGDGDIVSLPGVNTFKLTAKDRYGNPIPDYVFKYQVEIDNEDGDNHTVIVNGQPYVSAHVETAVFPVTAASPVTGPDGIAMFEFSLSDDNFGWRVDILLNDGDTVIW